MDTISETTIIDKTNENDVLGGRGNGPNLTKGNLRYIDLVKEMRHGYVSCSSVKTKTEIAKNLYYKIKSLSPPGRFLKKMNSDVDDGLWIELSEKEALNKIKQALRERKHIGNDNKNSTEKDQSNKKLKNDTSEACFSSQPGPPQLDEKINFDSGSIDDISMLSNAFEKSVPNYLEVKSSSLTSSQLRDSELSNLSQEYNKLMEGTDGGVALSAKPTFVGDDRKIEAVIKKSFNNSKSKPPRNISLNKSESIDSTQGLRENSSEAKARHSSSSSSSFDKKKLINELVDITGGIFNLSDNMSEVSGMMSELDFDDENVKKLLMDECSD